MLSLLIPALEESRETTALKMVAKQFLTTAQASVDFYQVMVVLVLAALTSLGLKEAQTKPTGL